MNLPTYATLALELVDEHVLVATLNRPEVLNAISTQMGRDLLDLWTRLTVEPGAVRCAVLTGAGERAFCAGGDLKERNGMTDEAWRAQHELFERAFVALMECPIPVIAAMNGYAYGGGLETALGCDFIFAARGARFALSEVRLGIMPGGGGTQNLPRAVGERRAKELILAARPFTAELVTRLVTNGIAMAPITLHTGVSSQDAGEAPQPEWFEVPEATARWVNSARAAGERVVAVGTTVTRALESAAGPGGTVTPDRDGPKW